ncbi:MAG: hypothetical protein PHV06_08405 [bacterium]|nr:hypothetical protein [bacterium]
MIEDIIKIHDKYQFELKLNYKLKEDQKYSEYNVDAYLFLPNSLDINWFTYRKDDFYNDLQTNVRFKTPTFTLREISLEENPPLKNLNKSINEFVKDQNRENFINYEYQLKMFCCIVKTALRDHVDFIFKKNNENDIKTLITEYLKYVSVIRNKISDFRILINIPKIKKKQFQIYLFTDEYLSLLIENSNFKLIEILESKKFKSLEDFKKELLLLSDKELNYRKTNDYPSIPKKSDENEEFLFRQSVLKKFTGNVLFLYIKRTKEGRLLEHILFGLAAGFAMLFATAVAFYSQVIYGGLTLPVFIALVISYIFKDRIKEVMRYYFSSKIRNLLFDHKLFIFTNQREKVGYCKESFSFIPEQKLPVEIRKLRNKDHITEIENGWVGEKIILYREQIKLFSKKLLKSFRGYQFDGVNDIMRFNIMRFLNKMDNPEKSVHVFEDGEFKKIYGERVYHLNLILKYSNTTSEKFKRFRIIMNRNGIKRIEPVEFQE